MVEDLSIVCSHKRIMFNKKRMSSSLLSNLLQRLPLVLLIRLILILLLATSSALTLAVVAAAEEGDTTHEDDGTTNGEEHGGGNSTSLTTEDPHHAGDGGEGEEHEEEEQAFAVLLPWFAVACGILVFYVQSRYLALVPYTCVMFILGLFMGVGAVRSGLEDQLTISISQWARIDHEVLFLVFLPGLLFKDAIEVNFHLFVASIWQLLILAFPIVLLGTMLTACVVHYIFPYNWSFNLSLTIGSILAATDPVAVSALLNELGAPPRLKMLISGESLLNDGSAVVFYYIFSEMFLHELGIEGLGETFTVGQGFAIFFRMSLGGTAVGILFGLALVAILFFLDRRFEKEEVVLQVTATITAAYLSFYTSEIVCEMSGVIAVVMCGVVTSAYGTSLISDWNVMDSFWSLLEHLLNTVIFTLGGIEFGQIIANPNGGWTGTDWAYLFLLFVWANIIRFVLILSVYPINSRIGLGTDMHEATFSAWAGLRGAVGIALALGLHNSVREATDNQEDIALTNRVFGMVGGMAFLTLTLNAPLSGPLLKKLGLVDSTEARNKILKQAELAMRRRMLDDFLHLMTDPRFHFVDFALVMFHCPQLRDLTSKELEDAVEMNRATVHPDQYKAPNLQFVLPYIPDSNHLRWVIEKAARDMFMDPTMTGTIKPTFFDLESLAETGVDDSPPNPELVNSIRIMFIELLRASYQGQIRDGELDPREFNGYLSYVLLQSLDFAHDAAMDGKPLDDWNRSTGLSSRVVYRSQDFIARLYGCCCVKNGHKHVKEGGVRANPLSASMVKATMEERMDALHGSTLKQQQMRLDVLRALSFIDAHCEAEDRLTDEFADASTTAEAKAAFRVVMEESRTQVRKAKAVLRGKNKKELKHVISHYLCVVLQNKTARYIKVLLDSGVLLQREARHYLEEIDESIIQIRTCPNEEHPGAIVTTIEEEAEGDDPEQQRKMRRRRKRVKQKSLL